MSEQKLTWLPQNELSSRRAKLTLTKQALLEKRLRGEPANTSQSQVIARALRTEALPLSYAQERLWFLHQLAPASPVYHIPLAIRLRGGLTAAQLAQVLDALIQRHEALRTTFPLVAGQPVQHIAPHLSLPLPVLKLGNLPEAQRLAEARRLATSEAQQPFDLATGPLVRATLLQLDSADHVLLLTLHHIIADGWSLGILFHDLAALSQTLANDQPVSLPELPLQYADYTVWQRTWLSGTQLESQLAYWRQQLADCPSLALPTDQPHPPVPSFEGAAHAVHLSAELKAGLQTLSQQEGVTLFMTLLAAFQTLLCRYSDQTDVCVGTPIANRTHPEIEQVVGCFVNTLVLRTDLSGNPSFRELLRRVRKVTLAAYAHQDLPFEKLVEALQPERNLSRHPLFQVMLVFQSAPMRPTLAFPDMDVSWLSLDSTTAKFDLTLALRETPGGLVGSLEYNAALFDPTTIVRLADHLQTLLVGIVAHPDRRLADLPLLSAAERHQLLVTWNATNVASPSLCLHHLFEAQVARCPNAVAVVGEAASLSYADLNQRANHLAHQLQAHGIGPEVVVGVCLERSLELVIALLAILKAGAAYLPLDPSYPASRLTFMLHDAQVTLLLTQQHLRNRLPSLQTHVLLLDNAPVDMTHDSMANPSSPVRPEHLAYLFYTSGSTGLPKAVLISHRAITNRLIWGQKTYPLTNTDRVLQLAPFNFDFSVWEIFGALMAGAQLVLPHPEYYQDSAYLVRLIAKQAITVVHFVPSMLQLFLDEPDIETCSSLRLVFSGGETLSANLQDHFFSRLSSDLYNQYGPTEASVDVTCWACNGKNAGSTVPIGHPIANMQVYVLDRAQQLVPVGVPGELYIGGIGLARGYGQRPALTAERFLPHPFSTEPGARLYRTGDRVRFRTDGALEFLGRLDQQVKLRGVRLELGEVEAVLRQHPDVREAVVLLHHDPPIDPRLVAYVETTPSTAPTADDLRSFLATRLPAIMLPSAVVQLDALPRLSNGKLDRHTLPPLCSDFSSEDPGRTPRTPLEELLADLWRQVLGVERVGLDDSFFTLGGHSLLATQLMARVRQTFQVVLPLRALFEAPTVAGLAAHIEAAQHREPCQPLPVIARALRTEALPLSYAQERLWFLNNLMPGTPFFNIAVAVRLTGSLDMTALEQSLREIGMRHEALRTNFDVVDGQPVQVIAPTSSLQLSVVDLRELSKNDRDTEARRIARAEAQRPFDLAHGPLLRLSLVRLSKRNYVLLIAMHHIISDGWSMRVLFRELAILYEAFANGRSSPLPALPVQYGDFAHWQRRWLQGEERASQLAYWMDQLDGDLPDLRLPTDRPRPAALSFQTSRQSLLLPQALCAALQDLSRRESTTLFMTLLAAIDILLYCYTGQDDIRIGTLVANRTRSELEGLIGLFTNTLTLRTDLSGNPTIQALLQRVRETTLDAFAHQDLPFEELVQTLEDERRVRRASLIQVLFLFENAPSQFVKAPGLTLSAWDASTGMAEPDLDATTFDLVLMLKERPTGLTVSVIYKTALFNRSTIERMLRYFEHLLAYITSKPEQQLSALPRPHDFIKRQVKDANSEATRIDRLDD